MADVESRGGATVFRFSPASVRRALDAGVDAESLLAACESLVGRRLGIAAADIPPAEVVSVHSSAKVEAL